MKKQFHMTSYQILNRTLDFKKLFMMLSREIISSEPEIDQNTTNLSPTEQSIILYRACCRI